jgi:hypothetical protein
METLADNVKFANESFNSSMDNLFLLQGQWKKNNGKYIKDVVVGSTLSQPVLYEKKEVKGYVDYDIGPISLETRLDDKFLDKLNSFEIQALINKIHYEVSEITSGIFGNGEKTEIKKQYEEEVLVSRGYYTGGSKGRDKGYQNNNNRTYIPAVYETKIIDLDTRYQSSGKFGEYIGYDPSVRDLNAKTRKDMFYDTGEGELGRLLTEYIFFQTLDALGLAEISIAPWDKKMWDDRGSFFESPSIRSMTDFVLQVGVAVISIAGSAVTGGMSAVGGMALMVAINSSDDLTFAALDVAFGYKDWKEAGFEFGKALLMNTASAAVSGVFSGVSGATEGIFKGGLNALVTETATTTLQNVAGQAIMAGAQGFVNGTITSGISGITYSKEKGFGYDFGVFQQGMEGTVKNVVTSMISVVTKGTMDWIIGGKDMERIGNYSITNKKSIDTFNTLIGDLAGQGLNYAMGDDFTLNLLNTSLFKSLGLLKENSGNIGFLELHFGRDNTSMNFGTSGANVSIDNVFNATKGAAFWGIEGVVGLYNVTHDMNIRGAWQGINSFGDNNQKSLFWEVMFGKTDLRAAPDDAEYGAETVVNEKGKKTVFLKYQNGMDYETQMRLAAILGQEAYRDGYKEGDKKNGYTITAQDSLNEFRDASIARIAMGDRINQDHQWFYDLNMDFEIESYLLHGANASGNFEVFNDYMDFAYVNERDFFFQWASTRGDFQNTDRYTNIPLFYVDSQERVDAINAQRLQAAFEKYKARMEKEDKYTAVFSGNRDKSNEEILWDMFQNSEALQKNFGYKELQLDTIRRVGCMFMSTKYGLEAITGEQMDTISFHNYITENKLYWGDANLSNELMAEIMNRFSAGNFTVDLVFNGTPNVSALREFETSEDKYIAHLRVKDNGRDLIHSVMVSGIVYNYDDDGNVTGINKINVANPLKDYGSFYSKTSYRMNEIVRWDIFKVTPLSNLSSVGN